MKAANVLYFPLLILHALASATRAQQAQDSTAADSTVYDVEEIAVTVARPFAAAGGASAVRARVDSLRVGPAPTLEDVLRQLPLIQIRENSRGEAQPTLRGMESRRVAVLVDGVPLTLGWDDRTDLSIVPLTAAREITLIRGLSSVLHGPNALGGVVQIAIGEGSAAVREPVPFQLGASVDHLGNGQLSLGLGTLAKLGTGELLIRAGGGYRSRSELPRPSDVDAAVPGAGDERLNSDFEQGTGYVVARYQSHGGRWLSLSSFGHRSNKGVPPELHVEEPRLWRLPRATRWVTALSAGTGWSGTPLGAGDIEASIGIDFGETDIDNYATLAYDSVVERELGDDRTLSLRLLADHTLGPGILRSAFTLAETRHVETFVPGDRSVFRQRLWSLGIEAEEPIGVSAAPARVSFGFSVDGSDTPETGGFQSRDPIWGWGARLGGTVPLGNGGALIHGGVSRRVRFPALRELYSGALGRFEINPELDSEKLVVAELGLTTPVGPLEAQAVAFHQRLTDGIVRVGLGDGRFQRQNRDEILSTGLELLANYLWRRVALEGDLTLQNFELNDPTAPEEQQRPEHKPWIAGNAAVSGPIVWGVQGSAAVHHLGRQYCVNPETGADERLDAKTWLDLEVSRSFQLRGSGVGRTLEGALVLANATDSDVFDQCGLPQPGRLLSFQIRIF